jgi:ubiquinone/menaquinone biosynthesis C-methylase UbiE
MNADFRDHFSAHAAEYREFRPTYPPELFAYLASVAPARDLVWDCGTGNGQAAVPLAAHFARVFATDASAGQLQNAEPHPRVEYAVAPAEKCPLPDASADLVTVAQALHWFDLDRFYPEVRRVCRLGGIFAAWTYNFHSVNPAVDAVLARLQSEFIGPHWPPGREHVDAGYRTLPLPFDERPAPIFEMTAEWNLDALLGYINTWSAVKRFEQTKGYNPVERLREEFAAAWGDRATVRTARWALVVRVGEVAHD